MLEVPLARQGRRHEVSPEYGFVGYADDERQGGCRRQGRRWILPEGFRARYIDRQLSDARRVPHAARNNPAAGGRHRPAAASRGRRMVSMPKSGAYAGIEKKLEDGGMGEGSAGAWRRAGLPARNIENRHCSRASSSEKCWRLGIEDSTMPPGARKRRKRVSTASGSIRCSRISPNDMQSMLPGSNGGSIGGDIEGEDAVEMGARAAQRLRHGARCRIRCASGRRAFSAAPELARPRSRHPRSPAPIPARLAARIGCSRSSSWRVGMS